MVGLKTASENVATGDYVLLDGFNGVLVINPTDQTFEYGQLEKEQENLQDKLAEIRMPLPSRLMAMKSCFRPM